MKEEYQYSVITKNGFTAYLRVFIDDNKTVLILLLLHRYSNQETIPTIQNCSLKLQGEIRSGFDTIGTENCFYNYFRIIDITGKEINNGLGALAINEVISIAKKCICRYIAGSLGVGDLEDTNDTDHRSRLLHFYSKNGFTITIHPNKITGEIFLSLI